MLLDRLCFYSKNRLSTPVWLASAAVGAVAAFSATAVPTQLSSDGANQIPHRPEDQQDHQGVNDVFHLTTSFFFLVLFLERLS
jgi:hypothetical protein